MKFNWFNLIAAIPNVVKAVQYIHVGQPGESKKQKAMEWLGLGTAVLGTAAADPAQGQQIVNLGGEVGNIIDAVVSLFKRSGEPGFVPAAAK